MSHDREGLVKKTIAFAAFLRDRGFRVFQSSIHDALRAAEVISIDERADFFFCLRSNFASTDLEWTFNSKRFLMNSGRPVEVDISEGGRGARKTADPNERPERR
jgi:hypothetical protein